MKKDYRRSRANGKRSSADRIGKSGNPRKRDGQTDTQPAEIQLPLDRNELIEMLQDGLHSFAVEAGRLIALRMLEDEVTQLCGERYQRQDGRQATRYGHQEGYIVMAGQKVHLSRPRARHVNGTGEVPLERYAAMQQEDAMPEAALRRMVRGVSCRDYQAVVENARGGFGVKKSSVSRNFVRASAASVKELAERRFDEQRFVAIFVDGVEYAGTTMICVLGVTADGNKTILGLREGATENAEVVTCLLEEIRDRGVSTKVPTLFVLDGAKALSAAVKRVWGKKALLQRCQVHKKRNVKAHLPEKHWEEFDRMVHLAYHGQDHDAALKQLQLTARWLDRISPDAAASLREGMSETITVIRLQVPELLRKTLSTTNPIESAFHVCRSVTRRVKRWREGDMRHRWCTAGLIKAEERFRRVRGYKEIPTLLRALDKLGFIDSHVA